MRRLIHGVVLMALLGTMALSASRPAAAFKTFRAAGGNIHEQIMRRVLPGQGFTEAAVVQIDAGATRQDYVGTADFADVTHHFDNSAINRSRIYCEEEIKIVLSCLPDIIPASEAPADVKKAREARDKAQYHWGRMLHPMQDFYSHSNYLELSLAAGADPETIPPINWGARPAGLKSGYFTESEAVSRARAVSVLTRANPGVTFRTAAEYTTRKASTDYAAALAYVNGRPDMLHDELNKDNASQMQGRIVEPRSNQTLTVLAQGIATRETERQWPLLEARIRQVGGARADEMIRRFKGFGVPDTSVLFLVDTSGSMNDANKIGEARTAVADLVKEANAQNRSEEWAILSFGNHNAYEVQAFTQELSVLQAAAARLQASGDTPLRYGQAKAAKYLLDNGKGKEGKLIILCDGDDNCPGPSHAAGGRDDKPASNAAATKLQRLYETLKLPRGGNP